MVNLAEKPGIQNRVCLNGLKTERASSRQRRAGSHDQAGAEETAGGKRHSVTDGLAPHWNRNHEAKRLTTE